MLKMFPSNNTLVVLRKMMEKMIHKLINHMMLLTISVLNDHSYHKGRFLKKKKRTTSKIKKILSGWNDHLLIVILLQVFNCS